MLVHDISQKLFCAGARYSSRPHRICTYMHTYIAHVQLSTHGFDLTTFVQTSALLEIAGIVFVEVSHLLPNLMLHLWRQSAACANAGSRRSDDCGCGPCDGHRASAACLQHLALDQEVRSVLCKRCDWI